MPCSGADAAARHPLSGLGWFGRMLRRLASDESGEYAMEFLMILVFGVLPIMMIIPLLQAMLQEYVAFSQIFVTSPFF